MNGCLGWLAVMENRLFLPPQRNATEPSDQWFPAVAFDAGLEAFVWPVGC
jgi:hypothetical protein